jgi:hypothetical protein
MFDRVDDISLVLAEHLEEQGISPMSRRRPTTRVCPATERLEEKSLPSVMPGPTFIHAIHVRSIHEIPAHLVRPAHERGVHLPHRHPHFAAGHGAGGSGGGGIGLGAGAGSGVLAGVGSSNGGGAGSGNGAGNGNGSNGGRGTGWGFFNTAVLTLEPDTGGLMAPFVQVLADSSPSLPGQVYNVAIATVRNGTAQTFDVRSGLSVAVSGAAQPFPPGTTLWQPGQVLVFYSLSEQTFPPDFTFNLQGTSVQEPASIYYGIQYSPITLSSILNTIVSTVLVGSRYALVST